MSIETREGFLRQMAKTNFLPLFWHVEIRLDKGYIPSIIWCTHVVYPKALLVQGMNQKPEDGQLFRKPDRILTSPIVQAMQMDPILGRNMQFIHPGIGDLDELLRTRNSYQNINTPCQPSSDKLLIEIFGSQQPPANVPLYPSRNFTIPSIFQPAWNQAWDQNFGASVRLRLMPNPHTVVLPYSALTRSSSIPLMIFDSSNRSSRYREGRSPPCCQMKNAHDWQAHPAQIPKITRVRFEAMVTMSYAGDRTC